MTGRRPAGIEHFRDSYFGRPGIDPTAGDHSDGGQFVRDQELNPEEAQSQAYCHGVEAESALFRDVWLRADPQSWFLFFGRHHQPPATMLPFRRTSGGNTDRKIRASSGASLLIKFLRRL